MYTREELNKSSARETAAALSTLLIEAVSGSFEKQLLVHKYWSVTPDLYVIFHKSVTITNDNKC